MDGRGNPRVAVRVLAALALLLAGCGGERPTGGGSGDLDGPDVPLGWTTEPVFTLGGVEAPEWAAFGDVRGVGYDQDGNLHILDGEARRVVVVAPDGTLLRTVGREGEGPGEFRFPSALAVLPDGSQAVFDPGHGGFQLFGPDGAFRHSVPVDGNRFPDPEGPLAVTPDGGIVSPTVTPGAGDETGRPVILYSVDPERPHRVIHRGWLPPLPETREPGPEVTGGMRIRLPPVVSFHPGLLVAPLPDGRVAVADSTTWRVELLSPPGAPGGEAGASWRVDGVLERPTAPVTVTPALREAERALRLEEALADPPRLMVSNSQGDAASAALEMGRRLQEARIDGMGFHEVIPVLAGVGVDDRGRLWVERTGSALGEPGPTDVVTPGGRYLGTLTPGSLLLPDAFGPDGRMAHIGTDDLGAPVVRVVRRVEGGG